MFLFVTLWNYTVCDNGNDMKQYYFQNSYGAIAYKKVCNRAPIFNFFCGTPEFSIRGKFIPKSTIFRDFGAVTHIFTATTVKFGMRVKTWDFLLQTKFCKKNRLRGLPILGKFVPKNTNFGDFGGCTPIFLTHSDEIWRQSANLWLPPPSQFF